MLSMVILSSSVGLWATYEDNEWHKLYASCSNVAGSYSP